MINTENARSLVICYHNFTNTPFSDDLEVVTWGGMLRDAQIKTGVQMYPNELLDEWIADANRRLENNR